jgi:menaquinone-dependent protoporphyrinogen oxidase
VILGSSLYVGAIAREAKNFIAASRDILLGKPFGLFLSGFQPEEEQKAFESNFPPELLKAARTTCFLGGIYDPKKAGVLERLAMKAVAKTADYTDTIDNDRIRKFAGAVQA